MTFPTTLATTTPHATANRLTGIGGALDRCGEAVLKDSRGLLAMMLSVRSSTDPCPVPDRISTPKLRSDAVVHGVLGRGVVVVLGPLRDNIT